jgi:hypothetical protein
MAEDSETRRFRADTSFSYAQAVIALTELAHDSAEEFDFGPLDAAGMLRGGLTVTGPDLTRVTETLAGVPGLAEWEA